MSAIITKNGKKLLARQFVNEMTRSRVEGLLDAFSKLVGTDASQRQHTFVETDSVRYVYQPLDDIYVVLVTTKNSNILEDLEALRLFSRVIPEYCRSNDEAEILNKAFELIFAFDEIVALGYRENVNLAMIRTYTEMDSHEERVHKQILNAQMRDAINKGQLKAKELKKNHERNMGKGGRGISSATAISSSNAHNFTSADAAISSSTTSSYIPKTPAVSAAASSKGGGKALKLGARIVSDDAFLQQLRSEGQLVSDLQTTSITDKAKPLILEDRSPVYVQATEKLNASVSRNGGVESAEILGNVSLNITETEFNTVTLKMNSNQISGTQIQVHPNMDKAVWQKESRLKLKSVQKPYPLNTDVGLVKWRNVLDKEEQLPLTLNVFPNDSAEGCTVNIEFTLQKDIQLTDVIITIPLPPATQPVVSEVYGSYDYVRSKSQLLWTIPVIDSSSENGTLEFSVPNGHSDHFFPVNLSFTSESLICGIEVEDVTDHEGGNSVKHTLQSGIVVEKYEVI
jgi:hypothetical protein